MRSSSLHLHITVAVLFMAFYQANSFVTPWSKVWTRKTAKVWQPPSAIHLTTIRQVSLMSPTNLFVMDRLKSFLNAAIGVDVASSDSIRKALADPATTIVDARNADEIRDHGLFAPPLPDQHWIFAPGSPMEAPVLSVAASSLIRNKEAPVIIYCASGKRAAKAKDVLEAQGYTYVLNAGGLSDLDFMKE